MDWPATRLGRWLEVLPSSIAEALRVMVMFTGRPVRACARQAQPGDAVLLSPACASWDMYRNYVHRAEAFTAAVHRLQSESTSTIESGDTGCAP